MFSIKNHILYKDGKPVPFVATPHKAGKLVPQYLILHYTAATTASSTINWFKEPSSKVSAHLLIDREGGITQFAPFNIITYHAGISEYKGLVSMNKFSVGVEMVNAGLLTKVGDKYFTLNKKTEVKDHVIINGTAWQPFTQAQVDTARVLYSLLKEEYGLKDAIGHSDVSPNRKIDVGPAWPWEKFRANLPEKVIVKRTTTDLNLRIDPSVDFDRLQVLPANTQLTISKFEKNGFVYVSLTPEIKGWVSVKYLK